MLAPRGRRLSAEQAGRLCAGDGRRREGVVEGEQTSAKDSLLGAVIADIYANAEDGQRGPDRETLPRRS